MLDPWRGLVDLLARLDASIAVQPRYPDLANLRGLARAFAGDLTGAGADFAAALAHNGRYEAAWINRAWLRFLTGEAVVGADFAAGLSSAARAHVDLLHCVQTRGVGAALQTVAADVVTGWRALDRLWLLGLAGDAAASAAQRARMLAAAPAIADLLAQGQEVADVARWAAVYRGNPAAADVCRALADVELAMGRDPDRRAYVRWAAALSFDACAHGLAEAAHAEHRGDDAAALAALQEAVADDPQRAEAHAALGYHLAARGDGAAARAAFTTAVRLAPRYPDLRYQLALLERAAGRDAAAEGELRAALDLHAGYVLARLELGALLEDTGRYREALACLQQVRDAGVRPADVELRLGRLHARLGHARQARRARARAAARGR